jgi:fused signal recognition particle receptor
MRWFSRKDKKEPETLDNNKEALADPENNESVEPLPPQREGLLSRLKRGLSKTRESLIQGMDRLFAGRRIIDAKLLDELEELLITSDLGVATTMELIRRTRKKVERNEIIEPAAIKEFLREEILEMLQMEVEPLKWDKKPLVIMVIGVNGTGKTTTIGKLAAQMRADGKNVLLVAADTFRAAAIEQLEIWAERAGCSVVKQKTGADPSAVAFDGIQAALSREADVVIIDTAGRLHTKVNLMEELKKMQRTISRQVEGAPHQVWLVLDATTGQNAISQARMFDQALGVTGLILTKLDGTAKGGIVVGIAREMNIPVRFIGIGEAIEDLREFNPREFAEALL